MRRPASGHWGKTYTAVGIVFNATFDPVEKRRKALEHFELLRSRKFAENVYYHKLARDPRSYGYRIGNRVSGDFQFEGISQELCERFSKRRAQIDATLEKLLTDKPELKEGNIKELRARLVEAERTHKQKESSWDELQTVWETQLSPSERALFHGFRAGLKRSMETNQRINIGGAVQWAKEHLFDRNSVVLECQVWQQALERARGQHFSIAELKEFTRQRGYIHSDERPAEITMRDVLLREWEIVQMGKDGVPDRYASDVPNAGTKSHFYDKELNSILN